ncbi:hypothetical protein ACVWWK_008070 [Bradyrhizobium sp. LB9.1b]
MNLARLIALTIFRSQNFIAIHAILAVCLPLAHHAINFLARYLTEH